MLVPSKTIRRVIVVSVVVFFAVGHGYGAAFKLLKAGFRTGQAANVAKQAAKKIENLWEGHKAKKARKKEEKEREKWEQNAILTEMAKEKWEKKKENLTASFSNEENLFHAIQAVDADWVHELLLDGADPNTTDAVGRTPLYFFLEGKHSCAYWDLLESTYSEIDDLLAAGADPNIACGDESRTPLINAVYNRSDYVRKLLASGALAQSVDINGMNVLHHAVDAVLDISTLEELLRNMSENCRMSDMSDTINARDNNGRTPLHYAVRRSLYLVVKLLIESGADFTVKDNQGRTPLNVASFQSATSFLLPARRQQKKIKEYLALQHSARSAAGFVGTYDSAMTKNVAEGSSSSSSDDRYLYGGYGGAQSRHLQRTLLQTGRIDVAAGVGNLTHVKDLVSKGADVNASDINGDTALHKAAANGHLEVVRFLLGHGAESSAVNEVGQTPLLVAATNGYFIIVSDLEAYGADVNAEDGAGRTPLEMAAANGHLSMVTWLVHSGAQVSRLAREQAAINGHSLVEEFLKRNSLINFTEKGEESRKKQKKNKKKKKKARKKKSSSSSRAGVNYGFGGGHFIRGCLL